MPHRLRADLPYMSRIRRWYMLSFTVGGVDYGGCGGGRYGRLAGVGVGRVEGYGDYAAYVDADRGEDSAGADTAAESLVECSAVRERAGADNFGDAVARNCAGGGVRLLQACTGIAAGQARWGRAGGGGTEAAARGIVLRGV